MNRRSSFGIHIFQSVMSYLNPWQQRIPPKTIKLFTNLTSPGCRKGMWERSSTAQENLDSNPRVPVERTLHPSMQFSMLFRPNLPVCLDNELF